MSLLALAKITIPDGHISHASALHIYKDVIAEYDLLRELGPKERGRSEIGHFILDVERIVSRALEPAELRIFGARATWKPKTPDDHKNLYRIRVKLGRAFERNGLWPVDEYFSDRTYPPVVTIEEIQHAVARYFSISPADLKCDSQARRFVEPRQIAMYLTRQLTNASLPRIGRAFLKNHSTVLYSILRIHQLRDRDSRLQFVLNRLSSSLKRSS